jgi:hydrophobe/amphiphile efflux-1 (HAE1) family protein
MTLSDLSIKRPVFAWMLMFGLIVFGAISLGRLGVSQMPDIDFPVLNINVNWEGAAPEVMESEIVDRLEQAVTSIQGIQNITSSIRQGTASITLDFDLNRDVDVALQEVQANISRIRLPLNVDPPTIAKNNPDDQPIMWLGIASTSRSLHDLIVFIDLHLRDQFQILPGVGEVLLSGFSERNLRLWVDNEKLKKYELTILDLQKAIELEHTEIAAGYMENDKQELNIRMMGEGRSPEDVGNILISQRGGRPIYNSTIRVKDVARVEDSLNDIRRISRISGVPGVGLGIKKQRGSNAVEVAKNVRKRADELNKTLPSDMKIAINFDSTRFIEDAVHETEFTLVLSALITGLVCWAFLGSWNSTFNVLLSIPTSIIGTFMILYFMGFTLNFFTLLGLALAVGIVVDDAIMVLENIFRHLEMGKNRVKASADGAREITFAAVAASVAVIAIFLPVAFMKGIIGKFLFQFGVTISGAVALSLLEAITLTPMRCSQFLSEHQSQNRYAIWANSQFQRLADQYRRILKFCLNYRWTVIIISLIGFAASLLIAKTLRGELIPPQDMSVFIIRFQTPVGSSLKFTSDRIADAEKILKSRPEVLRYFAAVGGFGGGESNQGIIFVTMKERGERKIRQDELMNWCRQEMSKIPGVKRAIPTDLSMRGFSAQGLGKAIEFNIRGESYETLKKQAEEIIKQMEQTRLFRDLDTDYREGMPEVRVFPDRARASVSSVSMDSIGKTVNAAIGGVREGKYTHEGRRYDVRLRLNPEERVKAEDIEELQVRTTYGELIPLKDVITTETIPTLQTITRRMRERSITISANLAQGQSQAKALDTAEQISKKALPEGYRFFLSGNAEAMRESFGSLGFAFMLGIVVSYMVLASQFNSFIHPFTVLLALPFSISGALLALKIGDQSINLYSIIGIVLLAGIVKKNSILLVEFTNKKRYEDGMNLQDAILTAGPIRLRPILMTSCATLAAAIPPALAFGPGAESRIPMAITIIGGVIVSTFFTLLVVPCAYSLAAKLERRKNIPLEV